VNTINNHSKTSGICLFSIEVLELYHLHGSPNTVRVIKSRTMKRVGHVAWKGEGRGVHSVLMGKLRETDRWGDPGVDGKITLR
jgi:hypothetical protein